MKVVEGNWAFPEIIGMPSYVSLILAVLIEVGCSVLFILGIKTRLVSAILFLMMVSAIFIVHGSNPLFIAQAEGGGSKELAILYGIVYLTVALIGGGKYVFSRG